MKLLEITFSAGAFCFVGLMLAAIISEIVDECRRLSNVDRIQIWLTIITLILVAATTANMIVRWM